MKLLHNSIGRDLAQFINKMDNDIYGALQLETSSFLVVGWLVSVYSSVGLSFVTVMVLSPAESMRVCPYVPCCVSTSQ